MPFPSPAYFVVLRVTHSCSRLTSPSPHCLDSRQLPSLPILFHLLHTHMLLPPCPSRLCSRHLICSSSSSSSPPFSLSCLLLSASVSFLALSRIQYRCHVWRCTSRCNYHFVQHRRLVHRRFLSVSLLSPSSSTLNVSCVLGWLLIHRMLVRILLEADWNMS